MDLCSSLKRDFFRLTFPHLKLSKQSCWPARLSGYTAWGSLLLDWWFALRFQVQKEKPVLLPELVFEFPFSHLVTSFPKRQVTSPWCCLQVTGKCLVLQGASYGDSYHLHHHLGLRSECCWNVENNGQARLCSSHRVLMAWVWVCHYTALTVTLMGCSLFQLLKLILLRLLCQTETRSVCRWGTGAGRGFGCSQKRQNSGWNPSLPSPREDLLFSFGFLSRNSKVIPLEQRVPVFVTVAVPESRPSAPLPAPFPVWALLSPLAPLCAWVVPHTLKLLFSSFNNILQLISCFLTDSHSKSNLWQVLIWVMTTWSTFLVGNYWVRSEQIWYPLTVSEAGIFTTPSLEIHW